MRLLLIALLTLSLASPASPGFGASFDCSSARSPAEKLICSDSSLSALDETLARTYSDAIAVVRHSGSVRQEQRQWIAEQRDKAADAATMRTVYETRINGLRAMIDEARAVPTEVAAATLSHDCIAVRSEPDETCRIESTGTVAGHLSYQVQSYYQNDLRTAGGVIVLAPATPGRLRVVLWDAAEDAHFYEPEIITSSATTLLELPGSMEGTGHFDAGSLYHEEQGSWREIDTASWQKDLASRLPNGLAVWKGIFPNWRAMTAETPLWRKNDGNCCPTGGSVRVTLALRGDRIVLTGMQVSNKPLP